MINIQHNIFVPWIVFLLIALSSCGNASDADVNQAQSVLMNCGAVLANESTSRIKYHNAEVSSDEQCLSELQTSTCTNGIMSDWTGTYTHDECLVLPPLPEKLLNDITKFRYKGGFRVSPKTFGQGSNAKSDYSNGIFTYNSQNHSIFLVGHPRGEEISEFSVPEIVDTTDVSAFNQIDYALQNFVPFHNTERVDTGIDSNFQVTGMSVINSSLLVNYIDWYDAAGTEKDTSILIQNAYGLANSKVYGPYQLNGAAHSAGFISQVPEQWQLTLGGTHISGNQVGASINSRLSMGPTAFFFNPQGSFLSNEAGYVNALGLLDFSITNILYNNAIYDQSTSINSILNNEDLENNLWTILSGVAVGFIIPDSSTYVTIGQSGGHNDGIGYKIRQNDGNLCAGYCSKTVSDNYSYYWFWDLHDLVKVKQGLIEPYEVRPYKYGIFELAVNTGNNHITSGSFDAESNTLYLSISQGDRLAKFARPPLFLVYQIDDF